MKKVDNCAPSGKPEVLLPKNNRERYHGHACRDPLVHQIESARRTREKSDLDDDKRLVESIREHGVLTPLRITRDYVLEDGHRRLAAARHLGLETVPVTVDSRS